MSRSRPDRRREFFRRLQSSDPAGSYGAAKALIDATLNEVEDEMSGVPYNPGAYATDGRMYPVQEDNVRPVKGNPNVVRLRSVGHDTFVGKNGAFRIVVRVSKQVEVDRPGADGQHLPKDLK